MLKLPSIILLSLSLIFGNCSHKKKEKDLTLVLLGLASALSGNCLQIEKKGDKNYEVTAYGIPSGGCNQATLGKLTTTNLLEAKDLSDKDVNDKIKIFGDTGENACGPVVTTLIAAREAITQTTIETAANSAEKKCGATGLNGGGKYLYCNGTAAAANYPTAFRYVVTSSALDDTKTSVTAMKTALGAQYTGVGWSADQLEKLVYLNSTELSLFSTYLPVYTATAAVATCGKAVVAKYPTSKDPVIKGSIVGTYYGGKSFQTLTEVTDISTYTPALSAYKCGYGDNFTETAVVKKCDKTGLTEF